jgi:hypothetical protein
MAPLSRFVLFKSLEIDWVHRRTIAGRASRFVHDFPPLRFVTKPDGIEHFSGLLPNRPHRGPEQPLPRKADLGCDPGRRVYNGGCVEDCVDGALIEGFRSPTIKLHDHLGAAMPKSG